MGVFLKRWDSNRWRVQAYTITQIETMPTEYKSLLQEYMEYILYFYVLCHITSHVQFCHFFSGNVCALLVVNIYDFNLMLHLLRPLIRIQ